MFGNLVFEDFKNFLSVITLCKFIGCLSCSQDLYSSLYGNDVSNHQTFSQTCCQGPSGDLCVTGLGIGERTIRN